MQQFVDFYSMPWWFVYACVDAAIFILLVILIKERKRPGQNDTHSLRQEERKLDMELNELRHNIKKLKKSRVLIGS